MERVEIFSLAAIDNAREIPELCHSELFMHGKETGTIIWGAVLEAAVWVDNNRYLLFLTDGLLYEDTLNIYLFDIKKGIQETIKMGATYADGYFENLEINTDSVSFDFLGNYRWTVNIFNKPVIRIPFTESWVISRDFRFTTYLKVTKTNIYK
ncbi:hypothetical protein HV213_21050 [Klebsiella sp. RHBSTW-00484]|uniref:hypothetical protein n=1 Tax=unclassified Klebsiella TaxID=2608929 RepID=UPI0015E4AD28|nr:MULTISPECIES: hypothetical protein [unclassified Klebsiella]MBA7845937.1 hypothetical protein [Klebsiella sp. RHBSTW-00465]QLO38130.1 hypothetical protein HV213_21050 [Klebsiella sp. RHBSTW-00484]QLT77650.1 hypothetical protein HV204_21050 [Klebsiella sp. RHBSTW-00464]